MRVTSVAPYRATLVGLAFAFASVLGTAGSVFAQNPPAQQAPPQQAAQPQKPYLTFQGDLGELLLYVKPDKTADFETLMGRLREALTKLDTPESKQQLSTLKVFRAQLPPESPNAVYILVAEPPVKGAEYWFLAILYKAFPEEAKALADKWTEVKGTANQAAFDLVVVK